jgi:NAD(P)-dependent dehydrogenase (short-subunit alcohol dehydrogenase family)
MSIGKSREGRQSPYQEDFGAAATAALRARGWNVAICGRRPGPLETVAAATGAHPIVAAIGSDGGVDTVVSGTIERFGRLDGLVLNAGINRPGPVGDLSDEDWDAMVETHLAGPFRLTRAALPHLLATREAIVGVASAAALRATAAIPAYNATKAGLAMLMQTVAVDYGPAGIGSNAVCPGWTRSEMADSELTEAGEMIGVDREEAYRLATAFVPSRRPAESSELGQVIAWLLSPESAYVNAAVSPVDGGLIAVEPTQIPFDPRVKVTTEGPAPLVAS